MTEIRSPLSTPTPAPTPKPPDAAPPAAPAAGALEEARAGRRRGFDRTVVQPTGQRATPPQALPDFSGAEVLPELPMAPAGGAAPGAAGMRARADAIFTASGGDHTRPGSKVMHDTLDANGFTADLQAKAAAEVKANGPQEAALRAGLAPDQQAAYDRVAAQIDKAGLEGQPDHPARLALQVLLAEGRLTGGAKNTDGDDLLAALDKAASQDVAEGIQQPSLVADMVQELASPSCINQHQFFTCAPTSLQIKAAMERPAEYARLVGGLASPDGKVKLAGGDTLQRAANTAADDKSGRTQSSRLWQAALMAYGDRSAGYTNAQDADVHGKRGQPVQAISHAASGVFGEATQVVAGPTGAKAVLDAVRAGKPTSTGLVWGKNGHDLHQVLVTKVDDAKGRVYFTNPWGTREVLTSSDFNRLFHSGIVAKQ